MVRQVGAYYHKRDICKPRRAREECGEHAAIVEEGNAAPGVEDRDVGDVYVRWCPERCPCGRGGEGIRHAAAEVEDVATRRVRAKKRVHHVVYAPRGRVHEKHSWDPPRECLPQPPACS